MYNPEENRFIPISPELQQKFVTPGASLTATEQKQRGWTRFEEGETISVKGLTFRVHEISESRLVLKPVKN